MGGGEERVYYFDAERRMQAIPWLQVAAGRWLLRFADCLALVAWARAFCENTFR